LGYEPNSIEPIKAVYISSNFNLSPSDCQVMLPHAKGGHPQTGLDRPSAAMCDWRNDDVDEDNITSYGNLIYGSPLKNIMAKVAELSAKGDGSDEKSAQS
jgi:hypothetical protein